MSSEWWPIDTAPKDGSWILLLVPTGAYLAQWHWYCDDWATEGRWEHSSEEDPPPDLTAPTHWQAYPGGEE